MAIEMPTIIQRIMYTMDGTSFSSGLKSMGSTMASFGANVSKVGKGLTKAFTIPVLAVGAASIDLAMKQQTALATVQGTMQITSKEAKAIGDAFMSTKGKSEYSATAMLNAFAPVGGQLKLINGGAVDAAQSLKFMSTVADLNTATGGQLGSTTATVANILQAYKLNLNQAGMASDYLFNMSKAVNIPIDTLATTLVRVHGRLQEALPTLGDTSTLLVALAHNSVVGARATQAVSTAFNTILAPTAKVSAVLQDITGKKGGGLYDASGKFLGMKNMITQLGPAFKGHTQQWDMAIGKLLFGSQAYAGMTGIMKGGVSTYEQYGKYATKTGTAQSAAAKQAETLHWQIKKIEATMEDWGAQIGTKLIPDIEKLIKVGEAMAHWFDKLSPGVKKAALYFVLVAAVLGPVLKIGGKFLEMGGKMLTMVGKLGTAKWLPGGKNRALEQQAKDNIKQEEQAEKLKAKMAEIRKKQGKQLAQIQQTDEEDALTAKQKADAKQEEQAQAHSDKMTDIAKQGGLDQEAAQSTTGQAVLSEEETQNAQQAAATKTGQAEKTAATKTGGEQQVAATKQSGTKATAATKTGQADQTAAQKAGEAKQTTAVETGQKDQKAAQTAGQGEQTTAVKTGQTDQTTAQTAGEVKQTAAVELGQTDQLAADVAGEVKQDAAVETGMVAQEGEVTAGEAVMATEAKAGGVAMATAFGAALTGLLPLGIAEMIGVPILKGPGQKIVNRMRSDLGLAGNNIPLNNLPFGVGKKLEDTPKFKAWAQKNPAEAYFLETGKTLKSSDKKFAGKTPGQSGPVSDPSMATWHPGFVGPLTPAQMAEKAAYEKDNHDNHKKTTDNTKTIADNTKPVTGGGYTINADGSITKTPKAKKAKAGAKGTAAYGGPEAAGGAENALTANVSSDLKTGMATLAALETKAFKAGDVAAAQHYAKQETALDKHLTAWTARVEKWNTQYNADVAKHTAAGNAAAAKILKEEAAAGGKQVSSVGKSLTAAAKQATTATASSINKERRQELVDLKEGKHSAANTLQTKIVEQQGLLTSLVAQTGMHSTAIAEALRIMSQSQLAATGTAANQPMKGLQAAGAMSELVGTMGQYAVRAGTSMEGIMEKMLGSASTTSKSIMEALSGSDLATTGISAPIDPMKTIKYKNAAATINLHVHPNAIHVHGANSEDAGDKMMKALTDFAKDFEGRVKLVG